MKELKLSEEDASESEAKQRPDRRTFVHASHTPENAVTWRTKGQRSHVLWPWREAVSRKFAERPRCLRLAWLLDHLFGDYGFAFPTDAWVERKIGLPINKVQETLLALERGEAIIRASAIVDDRAQRRIWPNSLIIPPTVGGHTKYYRKSSRENGLSTTARAAQRDAELRESKTQNCERMRANGAMAEGPAQPHPSLPSSPRGEDL